MNFGNLFGFTIFTCGLVGLLMLMLVGLAYLRSRRKLGDKAGAFIISVAVLVMMIALSIGNF